MLDYWTGSLKKTGAVTATKTATCAANFGLPFKVTCSLFVSTYYS